MSIRILGSQSSPSANFALRRRFWAGIFAEAIAYNRQARGLSVEPAAESAGMAASEWAAIEAGSVPQTTAQLQSMGEVLEIGYDKLLNLVLLCRDAWEL
jgi:transcriptional regulator with XRE-family HTH domain